MSDAPSPFDPLFDDEDADGETVIPSGEVTMASFPASVIVAAESGGFSVSAPVSVLFGLSKSGPTLTETRVPFNISSSSLSASPLANLGCGEGVGDRGWYRSCLARKDS
jgi:hypothetical protein